MLMSDQDSVRKESLSAYQRWEMASFDPVPEPEPVDDGAFEAELQRLRDAGQAHGYQAGYDQGYAQGLEQGRVESHAEAARLAAIADTFSAALGGARGE